MPEATLPKRFMLDLSEKEVLYLAHLNGLYQSIVYQNFPMTQHALEVLSRHVDVWNDGLNAKFRHLFESADLQPIDGRMH
jgi:hypothetical protein